MGFAAGMLLALGTATLAQAHSIDSGPVATTGAEVRAAVRVGGIRGTISYDEVPATIVQGAKQTPADAGIDPRPTGSITPAPVRPKPKIEWEIFDRYGRPVTIR